MRENTPCVVKAHQTTPHGVVKGHQITPGDSRSKLVQIILDLDSYSQHRHLPMNVPKRRSTPGDGLRLPPSLSVRSGISGAAVVVACSSPPPWGDGEAATGSEEADCRGSDAGEGETAAAAAATTS